MSVLYVIHKSYPTAISTALVGSGVAVSVRNPALSSTEHSSNVEISFYYFSTDWTANALPLAQCPRNFSSRARTAAVNSSVISTSYSFFFFVRRIPWDRLAMMTQLACTAFLYFGCAWIDNRELSESKNLNSIILVVLLRITVAINGHLRSPIDLYLILGMT